LTGLGGRPRITVVTVIVGVAFVVEGLVTVALALSVPTATFLVASRVSRWAVLAIALAGLAAFVRLPPPACRGPRVLAPARTPSPAIPDEGVSRSAFELFSVAANL
jgi:hypothetical protein